MELKRIEIIIEPALLEDYEGINSIIKEVQDEHAHELPHIFSKVDQTLPENYFRTIIENSSTELLVAKTDGTIIGFSILALYESPSFDSLTPRKFTKINYFGVNHHFQRKGIGTRLFNASVKWSKNKDASSLDLDVWEFNKKAISFYNKMKMKSVSRKMSLPL